MTDSTSAARAKGTHMPVLVMSGLLAGPFLSMVDSNIVNVALPDIASSLNAPLTTAQWIVSGYLLALAGGLAASAYLARRYGTRRVYLWSLLAFTVTSAACAFATDIGLLIVLRAAQGALGAPLVPLAMNMLLGSDSPEKSEFPAAAGIVLFLAPALGLLLLALTTAALLLVTATTPVWVLALLLSGRGLAVGLVIQPLLTAMLAGLRPAEIPDGNTLFNGAERLGGSLGISLLITLFSLCERARVQEALQSLGMRLGAGQLGGSSASRLPPAVRQRLADAAVAGFHDTVLALVIIASLGCLAALLLQNRTPAARPKASAGVEMDEVATARA